MTGWGIDVGVGSIGFAVIERDSTGVPAKLIDGVSHIFPSSIGSAERRSHRGIRARYRRQHSRLSELAAVLHETLGCDDLVSDGCADRLFNGKKTTSRIHLRAEGLEDELSAGDLFKAVLHIAQNRGQRLTRGLKDESKDEEKERTETANQAVGTRDLLKELGQKLGQKKPATPGQLLYDRLKSGKTTRLRKDAPDTPVFTRGQVEDELTRLLCAQRKHFPGLKDAERQRIFALVFWEADPKPPSVGRCMYGMQDETGKTEERLKAASELFQRKRIYEEVNNLRLRDRRTALSSPLTLEQRDAVVESLLNGKNLTPARLRKLLDLGKGALSPLTSLEEQKGRKGRKTDGSLAAHPIAEVMAKNGDLEYWHTLTSDAREEFFDQLATQDETEKLEKWLKQTHAIEGDRATTLCAVRLPTHRTSAGKQATAKLLEQLEADVVSLFEAEQHAGLKRNEAETRKRIQRLPYYGELFPEACVGGSNHPADPPEIRYGRLPNPVVHTAMNRLRKLANEFVKHHGSPQWINIELARDLNKSADERAKIERTINSNQKKNDEWGKIIRANGARVSRRNLMKMRLYDWQAQTCLYTGKTIALGQLFTEAVEIDHILPRQETMDDGVNNLALVVASANQFKAKRTPYEAFNSGYDGRDYPTILQGVEKLRRPTLWRFEPDAMDRYRKSDAMPSRFLSDTRYIAKLASAYLAHLLDDRSKITTVTGGMTGQLRHLWGLDDLIPELMVESGHLDRKYLMSTKLETDEQRETRAKFRRKLRFDHRHHLLDAIVVGCSRREDVTRLETLAARVGGYGSLRDTLEELRDEGFSAFRETGLPWSKGFRETVKTFLAVSTQSSTGQKTTRVTHKPDHNPLGELHAQTHFGIICKIPNTVCQYVCASHEKLAGLTKIDQVRAIGVAPSVIEALQKAIDHGVEFSWGAPDPMVAILNLQREQDSLRDMLLAELENAPADLEKDDQRIAWVSDRIAKKTGQRRYKQVEIKTLRVLKGPTNESKKNRPVSAVATANNDRLIHWLDRDGNAHWDVIASIDAAQPNFKEPWEDGAGLLIFRLRKNDIVEMNVESDNSAAGRALYRLASLSPGDQEFVPIEEARTAIDGRRIYTRRLASDSARDSAQIRTVVFTPGGRQKWQSRSRN